MTDIQSIRKLCPGYLEGDHTSLDAISELTGFALKKISGVDAWTEPTALGL